MQPGRRVTRGSLKIEAMVKMSMTGTPNRARIVITEGCQLKRLPAESRKTLRPVKRDAYKYEGLNELGHRETRHRETRHRETRHRETRHRETRIGVNCHLAESPILQDIAGDACQAVPDHAITSDSWFRSLLTSHCPRVAEGGTEESRGSNPAGLYRERTHHPELTRAQPAPRRYRGDLMAERLSSTCGPIILRPTPRQRATPFHSVSALCSNTKAVSDTC
jgi:hypothetical protein